MIFVTVGAAHLPFDRLIRAVDQLAEAWNEEAFVVQTGCSTCEPLYAEWFRFAAPLQVREWIARADVVVAHGGFGVLSDCIRSGKRVVACPRQSRYGEAVNPQHELVNYLAERGFLVPLYDVADLASAIEQAGNMVVPESTFESKIPEIVARYVQGLAV